MMSSLDAQIRSLRTQLQDLQATGEVAPDQVWISRFSARNRPGGKIYHYYKLMEQVGTKVRQKCYLGKPSSPKYKRWEAAIAQRNQIQTLQRQLNKLEQLAERALRAGIPTKITPSKPIGGRGRKVTYTSVIIRIPEPLVTQVKALTQQFYASYQEHKPVTGLCQSNRW